MPTLTVYNETTGETVMDAVSLDDLYIIENGSWVLKEEENKGLNGVDIFIGYIGSTSYRFSAEYYDLKIWENAPEITRDEYFSTKVTKPTCSSRGYTTHTCTDCGYSYKDTYTDKVAHSFGDWAEIEAPTCTEPGTQTRKRVSFRVRSGSCGSCTGCEWRR